jgi:deoxyhypusine synthase
MYKQRQNFLRNTVRHIDITRHNVIPLVEDMAHTAFSARDLHRAASIYDRMLKDKPCGVILCLAGSLISAGLKKVCVDLLRTRMVDVIVATGANIVDQDFFEALGFKHYQAEEALKTGVRDDLLRELKIDRIYDTLISESDLRSCDLTVQKIADELPARPYSSREFIREMGAWLHVRKIRVDSIVREAYKMGVPIFCPAFSDCSAGFGLVAHQHARPQQARVTLDSAKDFYELTKIKVRNPNTGLFMIGGGVPKNFAQDVVVSAEIIGAEVPMHKYAIQITVADVRDGALSGSTLREASSWGKVDTVYEQMVYAEATLALPLIAGYAYHKKSWKARKPKRFNDFLDA